MKQTTTLLNVKLSTLDQKAMKEKIHQWLQGKESRQVVTPNPEILLTAIKDDEFHYILNQADLAIPDGIGLKFAALMYGQNLHRLTGADLVIDILDHAQKHNLPVAIINWRLSLSTADLIKKAINSRWPKIRLLIQDIDNQKLDYNLEELKQFEPTVLLCSLGAPLQDKLIYKLRQELSSLRLSVGIGGSFDYLTNKTTRAPEIVQSLGLEWLWRVVIQPENRAVRMQRAYNAVIRFTLLALKERYINPFLYRKNVVGFLVRNNKILILNSNKSDEDYWKIPQGGVDSNETPRQALLREMQEEIGTNNFNILAEYEKIFKYRWTYKYGIMGYKGQKQDLYILEFLGKEEDIILSHEHKAYRWVPIEELTAESATITRPAYELFIQKYKETIANKK